MIFLIQEDINLCILYMTCLLSIESIGSIETRSSFVIYPGDHCVVTNTADDDHEESGVSIYRT